MNTIRVTIAMMDYGDKKLFIGMVNFFFFTIFNRFLMFIHILKLVLIVFAHTCKDYHVHNC
jgi:hypothetical protein